MTDAPTAKTLPPVFMYGMDRSGTTMLSLIVGAHPDIAVPYPVAGLWYTLADKYSPGAMPFDGDRCAALIEEALAHNRIKDWDVALTADLVEVQLKDWTFPGVVDAFYRAYAGQVGKANWAQMDIRTLDRLTDAADWFPDARFVHIVRDGRDVAVSHQSYPFGAGNIAECAHAWAQRVRSNCALGRLLGPRRYHLLRYEDLILAPEETLRELCDFLDVGFSPEMLKYRETIDSKVPGDRMWLWSNLRQPMDRSKVARWRQDMTATQRLVFEDIAGDLLEELGYERLKPLKWSARAEALALYYHATRGGRVKRLSRRLGLAKETRFDKSRP
jgi:hypothetical protein